MKKMLKILSLILVIATVVFVAGCAEPADEGATDEEHAEENADEGHAAVDEHAAAEEEAEEPAEEEAEEPAEEEAEAAPEH